MILPSGKAAAIGRLIGWVAVAASLGFIGLQLWRHAPWRLASTHLEALAAAVIGGALLYGVAGFLLSSAWYQLLGAASSSASLRWHHAVYGRTQIAKYLPGNVFHLVGRQVMGRRLGHRQGRLALASLLEALLLMLIAAALSLPILWQWLDRDLLWILALAGPVLALMAARWACRHAPALRDLATSADHGPSPAVLRLLRAAALYGVFFLVVAAIFWVLALSVGDPSQPSIDLASSVSVVALAWLVGFATPGSSAGIGVREAVLIAALESSLGVATSGLIALALRLVTIAGDVVFFTLSVVLTPAHGWSKSTALGDDLA
jgi:glycosyltransferase 2 family protein